MPRVKCLAGVTLITQLKRHVAQPQIGRRQIAFYKFSSRELFVRVCRGLPFSIVKVLLRCEGVTHRGPIKLSQGGRKLFRTMQTKNSGQWPLAIPIYISECAFSIKLDWIDLMNRSTKIYISPIDRIFTE